MLYKVIKAKSEIIMSFIKEIAKCSYEIFLVQMLVFVVFQEDRLFFIQSTAIRIPIWMMLTFAFSVLGGILMNRIMQKILTTKK